MPTVTHRIKLIAWAVFQTRYTGIAEFALLKAVWRKRNIQAAINAIVSLVIRSIISPCRKARKIFYALFRSGERWVRKNLSRLKKNSFPAVTAALVFSAERESAAIAVQLLPRLVNALNIIKEEKKGWIPACAGMTEDRYPDVLRTWG